jgi:ADP-ribosyl-[dinitrogen reductase] hydrolase
VEFRPRGTFEPLTDMVGGGPHHLLPGQWTDDTSMALCLATSLVERQGFDADDQMRRYSRWAREGYLSSTGKCFDIGLTVRAALQRFEQEGNPFAGSTNPQSAGNGCIMRLAPIPMWFFSELDGLEHFAAESARTTHGATECIDACRLFARIIYRALRTSSRDDILLGDAESFVGTEKIVAIARGAYLEKTEQEIRGSGYVVQSLEAALWAFARTNTFKDAILLAANLGDDADTTAAVCGQLAGAYYGEPGIPSHWLERLALREEIAELADEIYRFMSTPWWTTGLNWVLSDLRRSRKRPQPRVRATLQPYMTPMPETVASVPFQAEYSSQEADAMSYGILAEWDDKWDIVAHDGRIAFYRIGTCVYDVRLELVDGRYRVAEARVNRDPEQYPVRGIGHDDAWDAAFLGYLMNTLAGRDSPIPRHPNEIEKADSQKSVVTPARPRLPYLALAAGTIAAGLLVRGGALGLSAVARDVVGDALWAAMMLWMVSALAPGLPLRSRGGAALWVCVLVEVSQLYHAPWIDTARQTLPGQLVLGSGYDPRDIIAYAVGVLAGAMLDRGVRNADRSITQIFDMIRQTKESLPCFP